MSATEDTVSAAAAVAAAAAAAAESAVCDAIDTAHVAAEDSDAALEAALADMGLDDAAIHLNKVCSCPSVALSRMLRLSSAPYSAHWLMSTVSFCRYCSSTPLWRRMQPQSSPWWLMSTRL